MNGTQEVSDVGKTLTKPVAGEADKPAQARMKRATKQPSPLGFVSVADFVRITGYGETTVRNMVNDGLLGDVLRSSDKASGEIKINLWLALEKRGLKPDSIERLRSYLQLDRVEEVPTAPTGFTVTIVSGVPVQLLSFAPAVAPR